MNCLKCSRAVRPAKTLLADYPGTRASGRRGLCNVCYLNACYTGTLSHFPMQLQRWEDYREDYEMLARQGLPRETIAERLGLSFSALSKALERHKVVQ